MKESMTTSERNRLNKMILDNRIGFVIEASEVKSMAESSGLSVLELLPTLVPLAQSLARPPISNFSVGAVGLGSDGRVFFGVNVEFPGVPLHHSVHAEQFLLINLAVHGCPRLLHLTVSEAPCGHCRQFFQELRDASDLQIMITKREKPEFKPLSFFLPSPFGPSDLLDEDTPLLLEKHDNGLSLISERNEAANDSTNEEMVVNSDGPFNVSRELYEPELKIAALKAANESHAPYSGSPSGVALMSSDGKVLTGSYVESAAFNPSFGPLQAALVDYIAGGGGEYEDIVAAVLVEKEGTMVRQEETARLLLNMISPKCQLRVFLCRRNADERASS